MGRGHIGAVWSQNISAQFSYFPGPDRAVWFSPNITVARPLDHVSLTVLHWPSGDHVTRHEFHLLFLRVAHVSGEPGDPELCAL